MTYAEILNLLDRGMTPAQIMELSAAPAPEQSAAPAVDPVMDPAPIPEQSTQIPQNSTPDWVNELNANLARMTNALHANAIMNSQQPEQPPMTAEQALAEIIAPPKSRKG